MEFYAFDHQKPCLFTCHICPKIFAGADFLRSHLARRHNRETVGLRLELDKHFDQNFGQITRVENLQDFEDFKRLINANSTAISTPQNESIEEKSVSPATTPLNSQVKDLEESLTILKGAIDQLKCEFHSLKEQSGSKEAVIQLTDEWIQTDTQSDNFYEIPRNQTQSNGNLTELRKPETSLTVPIIQLPEEDKIVIIGNEESPSESLHSNTSTSYSEVPHNTEWLSSEMRGLIKQDVSANLTDILFYFGVYPEAKGLSFYDYSATIKRLEQKRKTTEKVRRSQSSMNKTKFNFELQKFPDLMALRETIDNRANKLLYEYLETQSARNKFKPPSRPFESAQETRSNVGSVKVQIASTSDQQQIYDTIKSNLHIDQIDNEAKLDENLPVECLSDLEEIPTEQFVKKLSGSTLTESETPKFALGDSYDSEHLSSLPETEIKERLSEWLTTDLSKNHPITTSFVRDNSGITRRQSIKSENRSDTTSVWAESASSDG